MSNAERTAAFFRVTDARTKTAILKNIAQHYKITSAEALEEVTDAEAESLLDYVTGPERSATHVLMARHGLA